VVICLERGANLHMAQLTPLPLTVSCFSKIQIGFTFLVPAHLGSPGQRAVKRVCVLSAGYQAIFRFDSVSPDRVFSFDHTYDKASDSALLIRYDTRCYFNVRSKADISQLNLPHGNDN